MLVDIVDGFLEGQRQLNLRFQTDPSPFTYENPEVHVTYGAYYLLYVDPVYVAHMVLEDGIAWYIDAELDDKTQIIG